MQWLILTEGLPVGAWRERVGLPNHCQLCPAQPKETLQHAFQDCPEIQRAWTLFRNFRQVAGLPPSYNNWKEINRGLMRAHQVRMWKKVSAGILRLLSLLTLTPHGMSLEYNYNGQYGVTDWQSSSEKNTFISE